ncbi:MAG: ATP-binding protein [Actinobacteria bacterium]|nr:ATP-binding protein [Actinomycetota bacterium]
MCELLAPLAEAGGVDLEAAVEPAAVLGDRRRVEQVVVNLVRNAIRATAGGAGSRVVVTIRREGEACELTVTDDGPGIPAPELGRVFERFYRGGSERDERTGSGLGLTIARRIVEGMTGTIGAEAVDGGGVRFLVRLPAHGEAGTDGA